MSFREPRMTAPDPMVVHRRLVEAAEFVERQGLNSVSRKLAVELEEQMAAELRADLDRRRWPRRLLDRLSARRADCR